MALPALVVLAAEPVYLLVDTAVVGHLGPLPLASLALGGGVLALVAWLGNVLAYGTTGSAARRFGAGDRAAAVGEGVQASWLAVGAGLVAVALVQALAVPLIRLLAGSADPRVAAGAVQWLRIAIWGAPFILLTMAGNGWMRGVQNTRRPMWIVLAANVVSAALCPVLVYGAGLGLIGSAIANLTAQGLAGLMFVGAILVERVSLAPHVAGLRRQVTVGRDLFVRGAAFQACFLSAAAVCARFGPATLAAHQITLQLWMFCALALDAVAIAAQSLVGAALGAGDESGARRTANRIAQLGGGYGTILGIVIAAGSVILPAVFSADPDVRAQALIAWPWFAVMQPLAGVVFALDGVLIGAGDARFMRNLTLLAGLGFFLPAIWLAYGLRLGIGGVWAGLTLFVVVRLVGLLVRLRGGAWAVAGAVR